jgi:hypothetical protein
VSEAKLPSKSECLNCGTQLNGKFCSECGQRSDIGRITFSETWNQFLSSAFSFEGPLLFSLKALLLHPGKMLRAYIGGRRKTYYQPVTFFILVSAIYLAIRALIGYDPLAANPPTDPSMANNAAVQAVHQSSQFMVKNINNILFILALSIGLVFKVFFRKKGNLAEFTAIGFYVTGVYILFGIGFMLVAHYLMPMNGSIQMLFLLIYTVYVMTSFLNKQTFMGVFKVFWASLLATLLYMVLGFGFSYLWVQYLS